jgi:hypothetical protein
VLAGAVLIALVVIGLVVVAGTYLVLSAKGNRPPVPVERAPADGRHPPAPLPRLEPRETTPQTHVVMTTYQDPQGRFTIQHPQDWKVQVYPDVGLIAFYQDDPKEGVSFQVLPNGMLEGEMRAAQVVQMFVAQARQVRPDLEITSQQIQPLSGGSGEVAGLDMTWTNLRRERMRTVASIRVSPDRGSTDIVYVGAQAPEIAYTSLQPTFGAMAQSYRETRG